MNHSNYMLTTILMGLCFALYAYTGYKYGYMKGRRAGYHQAMGDSMAIVNQYQKEIKQELNN